MAKSRDNFSNTIVAKLERRVNGHCSQPECRVPTSGPTTVETKANSIGVAAHITAAAAGGPRYDPRLSSTERRSISNAIWLCSNCSVLIDRDEEKYTVELLKQWKMDAESLAAEELGKKPVSRKAYETLKGTVLGSLPRRRISDAVSTICRLSAEAMEELDPRFTVEVAHNSGTTSYVFNPKERVDCTMSIEAPLADEFTAKFQNLVDHGAALQIDGTGVKLHGSPLFDLHPELEKIEFSSPVRRRAVGKVAATDRNTGITHRLDDIQGNLYGGRKSVTFEGRAFDGLFSLELRAHFPQEKMEKDGEVRVAHSLACWAGRQVSHLPYFTKLFGFYDAVVRGADITAQIELDGEVILNGSGSNLLDHAEARSTYHMLRYIRNVREILRFLERDCKFVDGLRISAEDYERVERFYNLVIELPKRRGDQVGSLSATLIPSESGAKDLQNLVDPKGNAVRLEQQYDDSLNIFGIPMSIPRLALCYSQLMLRKPTNLMRVKAGRSVRVTLQPGPDCAVTIFPVNG